MAILRATVDAEFRETIEITAKDLQIIKTDLERAFNSVILAHLDSTKDALEAKAPDERYSTIHWHDSGSSHSCRDCIRQADDERC